MADENTSNSSNKFSFLRPDELDMLRENNAIPEDLYSSIQQKIALAVPEQNMSVMSPEQVGLPSPEMVQETAPEAAPSLVPDMSKTPWLDVFTPEGLKAKAQEAAMSGNFDEADSLSSRLEDMEVKKEKSALEENDKKLKKYESDLKKAQTYNERAEKYGFAKIAEPSQEAYGIPQQSAPATDLDMVQANEPTVAEVQAAAAPARAVVAQQKALQNEQMLAAKKEQEAAAAAKLKQEQEAAKVAADVEESKSKDIAPWKRAFAIMLGSIGQGLAGGENMGLKAVQRIEDQIIEEKKYNDVQKKELRKQLLDEAKLELDQAKEATNNKESKYKIDKLKAEIQKLDLENNAALTFASRASSGDGFTPEQAYSLGEKEQARLVGGFKDGKLRPALDLESAKKLKLEVMPTAAIAIQGLNRLREINEGVASGKLDITGARAEAAALQQSLKGALRLELFGPGTFSDTEQAMADKIIKNPTEIISLKGASETTLRTLVEKIKNGTRGRLKAAGVQIPDSNNEVNISRVVKDFAKKGKKISRGEAMSSLIEKGLWQSEEELF